MGEDQNGSSLDPGSVQEDEYDDGLTEHGDIEADVEEEEEDGDDDDDVNQSQLSDEDENSKSEEGSSDVTHGTTPYTILKRSDETLFDMVL